MADQGEFLFCQGLVLCQATYLALCAGHQGVGFMRIPQQLALPLQIGACTRHLTDQAKAVIRSFGYETD